MSYRHTDPDNMTYSSFSTMTGDETVFDGKAAFVGPGSVQDQVGLDDNFQTHQYRAPIAEMSNDDDAIPGPDRYELDGHNGGQHHYHTTNQSTGSQRVRFGDLETSHKSMVPHGDPYYSMETLPRVSSARNTSSAQLFLDDKENGGNTSSYLPHGYNPHRPNPHPSNNWMRGMGTDARDIKMADGHMIGAHNNSYYTRTSPMNTPNSSYYPPQHPTTPTSSGRRTSRNKRRLPSQSAGGYSQMEDGVSDFGPPTPKTQRVIKTERPIEDPENRMIKELRVQELKSWEEIANILNDRRRARNVQGQLTEAAVYGRFKRNAKPIAESEGDVNFDVNDFMYLKKTPSGQTTPSRKTAYFTSSPGNGHLNKHESASPNSGPPAGGRLGRINTHRDGSPIEPPRVNFSRTDDRNLLDAVDQLEDEFWRHVADIVNQSSRHKVSPNDCKRRWSNLR